MAQGNPEVLEFIKGFGFDNVGYCSARVLRANPDVTAYCKENTCGKYGTNWACPPNCGTAEEFQDIFDEAEDCYVFQSIAELPNGYNFADAAKAMRAHSAKVTKLQTAAREKFPDVHVFGGGPCFACNECSFPEPCAHPDLRLVSMEASGLMVKEVADAAELPYVVKPLDNTHVIYTSILVM